ncbi:hypothetical protein BC940DRAFT_290829 [Gongronella butleri]|nr:hypothetical protein BC940DRAFT_290829 [Gongronella butleri]
MPDVIHCPCFGPERRVGGNQIAFPPSSELNCASSWQNKRLARPMDQETRRCTMRANAFEPYIGII